MYYYFIFLALVVIHIFMNFCVTYFTYTSFYLVLKKHSYMTIRFLFADSETSYFAQSVPFLYSVCHLFVVVSWSALSKCHCISSTCHIETEEFQPHYCELRSVI